MKKKLRGNDSKNLALIGGAGALLAWLLTKKPAEALPPEEEIPEEIPKEYSCPFCGIWFDENWKLIEHIKAVHPDKVSAVVGDIVIKISSG